MNITIDSKFNIGDRVIITYDGIQVKGKVISVRITESGIMYGVRTEDSEQDYMAYSLALDKEESLVKYSD